MSVAVCFEVGCRRVPWDTGRYPMPPPCMMRMEERGGMQAMVRPQRAIATRQARTISSQVSRHAKGLTHVTSCVCHLYARYAELTTWCVHGVCALTDTAVGAIATQISLCILISTFFHHFIYRGCFDRARTLE